jgi:hypothetical protein
LPKCKLREDIVWRKIFYGRGYCLEEDITWRRILYRRGSCLEENFLWKRISSSDDHPFRCLSSPFADTRAEPAYAMCKSNL